MQGFDLLAFIFGVIFTFGTPVILVALILFYRLRRTRLLHQTIMALVEKGQPIPEALLSPEPKRKRSDLRTGIILIAVGLGLALFFFASQGFVGLGDAWGVGIIPLFIGIGFVIAWKLEPGSRDDATPK